MRVVFGIGNPGSAYAGTRHNIGFHVLDRLAEARGAVFRKGSRLRLESWLDEDTLLVKPLTYVNRSGQALAELLLELAAPTSEGGLEQELEAECLLVVVDDVNLALGRLRAKAQGSSGGHNGLESLNAAWGSKSYPRLRIGVGAPVPGGLVEHVLGRFEPEELKTRDAVVDRAVEALHRYAEGAPLTELMATCNRAPVLPETPEDDDPEELKR